jgi:hypothetical protein
MGGSPITGPVPVPLVVVPVESDPPEPVVPDPPVGVGTVATAASGPRRSQLLL